MCQNKRTKRRLQKKETPEIHFFKGDSWNRSFLLPPPLLTLILGVPEIPLVPLLFDWESSLCRHVCVYICLCKNMSMPLPTRHTSIYIYIEIYINIFYTSILALLRSALPLFSSGDHTATQSRGDQLIHKPLELEAFRRLQHVNLNLLGNKKQGDMRYTFIYTSLVVMS